MRSKRKKIPRGILAISIISIVMGAVYLYFGATFFGLGNLISSYSYSGMDFGSMFRLVGVMLLALGALVIIMAIGLTMMAEWARRWGVEFYGLLAILALLLCLINPFLLISAALYLYFWYYLRNSRTRAKFDSYDYEKPNIHDAVAKRYQTHAHQEITHPLVPEPQSPEPVRVPEGMVLCPQCQMPNRKGVDTCRVCATDLPKD
ncbi:MAG: hypothetical protein V1934_05080 [Methanobacteriota archaeon]